MFPQGRKFTLSPKLKWGVGRGFSTQKILKWCGTGFTVVALLLTVNAVRIIWQHNAEAKSPNNPQVLGASTDQPVKQNTDEFKFQDYVVQKGDTLFNVSQKYNISWTTLATLNNLQTPFTLKPGSTLKIPVQ